MLLFAVLYVCLGPCLQPVLSASSFRTPAETYCSGGNSTCSHRLSAYGKITQSSVDFPLWTSAWCFKTACDQTTLKTWPENIQQQKSTTSIPEPGKSTRETWALKVSSDYLKETWSRHIVETPVWTETFPRSLDGISSDMDKTEPPSNSEEPFLTSACIPCWNQTYWLPAFAPCTCCSWVVSILPLLDWGTKKQIGRSTVVEYSDYSFPLPPCSLCLVSTFASSASLRNCK